MSKFITVILNSPRYGDLTLQLPTAHYNRDALMLELGQYGTVNHMEIRCTNIFDLRDMLISYKATLEGNSYCASPLYLGVSNHISTKLTDFLLEKGICVSKFRTVSSETHLHFLNCQQLHDAIKYLVDSLLSQANCPLFS